jgi:hypothetical protein
MVSELVGVATSKLPWEDLPSTQPPLNLSTRPSLTTTSSPSVLLDCISSHRLLYSDGATVDSATSEGKIIHPPPRHIPSSGPVHPSSLFVRAIRLFLGNLDGSIVDTLDDLVGVLAVNGASDRLGRAEDLLDGTGEGLGERVVGELSGNLRIQCQPVPFPCTVSPILHSRPQSRRTARFRCA